MPGGSFSKTFSIKFKPILYFSTAASYWPSTKYIWPDNAISTALANWGVFLHSDAVKYNYGL